MPVAIGHLTLGQRIEQTEGLVVFGQVPAQLLVVTVGTGYGTG